MTAAARLQRRSVALIDRVFAESDAVRAGRVPRKPAEPATPTPATPRNEAEWLERLAAFHRGPLPPREDVIAMLIARLRQRFPALRRRRLTYAGVGRLMRAQGIRVRQQSWFRAGMVLGSSFHLGGGVGFVDLSEVIVASQVRRAADRLVVLAHEWGHVILHAHDPRPLPAASDRDLDFWHEAEANLFAAALLRLPLEEIHRRTARAIMETEHERKRRRVRFAECGRRVGRELRRTREDRRTARPV